MLLLGPQRYQTSHLQTKPHDAHQFTRKLNSRSYKELVPGICNGSLTSLVVAPYLFATYDIGFAD